MSNSSPLDFFQINMDYSADLPINTMGRRIRTRLYFTSESHLHTVLNVLRFSNGSERKSILSDNGIDIINSTPELCYLTQIVMRVFEDCRPELRDDPKRLRVEILFSPGASATPLHLEEADRESDLSRVDTAPLQMIGRDNLTCEELESFFEEAMMVGPAHVGDEYPEAATSLSRPPKDVEVTNPPSSKADALEANGEKSSDLALSHNGSVFSSLRVETGNLSETNSGHEERQVSAAKEPTNTSFSARNDRAIPVSTEDPDKTKESDARKDSSQAEDGGDDDKPDGFGLEDDDESVDTLSSEVVRKAVARKAFWTTVAVGSFVLGASCILFAIRLADDSRHRRASRRYIG